MFLNGFSDAQGGDTRNPWIPAWPLEVLNTLTLTEQGGKTLLSLRGGPVNATEAERKLFEENFKGMRGGMAGTFDQLAEYLARA